MMWRSKDHRSAGLCWCCRGLLYAEVHRDQWIKGSNQLAFHHYPLQMVLIWAAMGGFLGLFSLISSPSSLSSSLAAAGAAADRFLVTEFAVDCWTTRRGPLGGVEDQLSSTFLSSTFLGFG
uniref:Uncharacterized protein n=1 Tax=Fagus sylvatica TaxID=28930 RepID=A0A2N9HS75_FAGSY